MNTDIKLAYLFGECSVQEYAESCIQDQPLQEACRDCEGMAEKCRQAIIDTIAKLDRVPRSDPIWIKTNQKATVGKIYDFALREIIGHTTDPMYAWALIGLSLQGGGDSLRVEYWRSLQSLNKLKIDWLVHSAWKTSAYWDDGNAKRLSAILNELNLYAEAEPHLDHVISTGDEHAKKWGVSVLSARL